MQDGWPIRLDQVTAMIWIGSLFHSAARGRLFPAAGKPLLVRLMQWNERGSCESGFQLVAERNLFCHSFDASVGAIAETVFA